VSKLAFYSDDKVIGMVNQAPYSLEWKDVPPGPHRLMVKAANSKGQISTSPVVVISVDENTVPVTSDLVCWLDPSVGIFKDADQQVLIWNDRSGNGHHAVHKEHNFPSLVENAIASKPIVRFGGDCRTLINGKFFIKEQYVVVRSPSATWNNFGSFLGRQSGKASSYYLEGRGSTGFFQDQFPAAVSKNGKPVEQNRTGDVGFNLGTITDFMVLKITVNDADPNPTNYFLSGIDGDNWLCKFDLAEIL
jgi:hypothetical protein